MFRLSKPVFSLSLSQQSTLFSVPCFLTLRLSPPSERLSRKPRNTISALQILVTLGTLDPQRCLQIICWTAPYHIPGTYKSFAFFLMEIPMYHNVSSGNPWGAPRRKPTGHFICTLVPLPCMQRRPAAAPTRRLQCHIYHPSAATIPVGKNGYPAEIKARLTHSWWRERGRSNLTTRI